MLIKNHKTANQKHASYWEARGGIFGTHPAENEAGVTGTIIS